LKKSKNPLKRGDVLHFLHKITKKLGGKNFGGVRIRGAGFDLEGNFV
jgi:hypothetical protein